MDIASIIIFPWTLLQSQFFFWLQAWAGFSLSFIEILDGTGHCGHAQETNFINLFVVPSVGMKVLSLKGAYGGNEISSFHFQCSNYRLTHSASALSGFTCASSLTMNEKFQYRTRLCECGMKISSLLLVNEFR